jgi:hypothetical protein
MNEHDDSGDDPRDDAIFEEAFSHLKRIEPPLETRIGNRMAVAAELGSLAAANRQHRSPWLRRSISIPVPIAAGLLAVLAGLVLQLGIRGGREPSRMPIAAQDQPVEHAAGVLREKAPIATSPSDSRPVLEFRETETYLCGVGRLSTVSGYFIRNKTDD